MLPQRSFAAGVRGVVLSLTLLTPAAAQEGRAPGRASPALTIFKPNGTRTVVSPSQIPAPVSGLPTEEPGVRAPRRPAPADAARNEAMRSLAGGPGGVPQGPGTVQAPKPGELQDVTLTTQRPWINEQAYMTHLLPYGTNTATGHALFNKNFPGSTGVYLNVLKGSSYLVDFVVDSWGGGTYRVQSGAMHQEFQNADGAQHLMVGVQPAASGWVNLFLSRPGGTGYYVMEVRVTRVN